MEMELNGRAVLNLRNCRRLSAPLNANEGIWASKHCSMVGLETPPGKLKRIDWGLMSWFSG